MMAEEKDGSDNSCMIVSVRELTTLEKYVAEKPLDPLEQDFVNRQRINNWTRSSTGGIKPIHPFSDNISYVSESNETIVERPNSSDKPRDLDYGDRQQPIGKDKRDLSATEVAKRHHPPTHRNSLVTPYTSPYFCPHDSTSARGFQDEQARVNSSPHKQKESGQPISSRSSAHQQQYASKPSPLQHNVPQPSSGSILNPEALRDATAPRDRVAAQSSSCPIPQINPLVRTVPVTIGTSREADLGSNFESNTYRPMPPVTSTALLGSSSNQSYYPNSDPYRQWPQRSPNQEFFQHFQTLNNLRQAQAIHRTVPGQHSTIPTLLPPRTAQPVQSPPTRTLGHSSPWWNNSDTLVNDILQYAGLLSRNGEVDDSKLDSNLHVLPEHDRDLRYYSEIAQRHLASKRKREVIVIGDSSDEGENLADGNTSNHRNRRARGSYTYPSDSAMPPSENVSHGLLRQNGTIENEHRRTTEIATFKNGTPQKHLETLSLQSRKVQNPPVEQRTSNLSIVIPSPNLKNLQNSLKRPVSSDHNVAEVDLADEVPSATRLPGSRPLSGLSSAVRESPAPASSLPYFVTINGKKRGRPFSTAEAAVRAVEKAARIAQTQTSHDPVTDGALTINGKKRGRPFQTPEAAAAAAAKAARLTNNDQTNAEFKKRGRPFSVNKEFIVPEGKYIPFLCEWEGCPAELNNLKTLRLHLNIVHGIRDKSKKDIPCRWGKCAKTHKVQMPLTSDSKASEGSLSQQSGGVTFTRIGEWKEHIEEAHLIPFSWHMGDGPADETFSSPPAEPSLPKDEPWLFDEKGKQVTPSVHGQRQEAGRASFNNGRRYLKQIRHMIKANTGESLKINRISKKLGLLDHGNLDGNGSPMSRSSFEVVLPAVQSPHDFVAIADTDSEDELAVGHDLGTNLDEVDVEMTLS
ncbi:hypothetical protein GLAREA_02564 [Glarea lozoyensis ATCC 20868]|uniref:C2H2-type domain-containing protein n=1 Tax=Glarea lozoyensis (strain ATCC 20868 / MF5171) TaxID=1116229 RepID=S3D3L0_GLAL2|nr:uncharacterized protein GLAREA_02564 [Glarea lozoyensis ATCC 20868]EPE26651.1 hypothetical protein GLAREA_02564 [Glarea lozoyensis ATCC 20868]